MGFNPCCSGSGPAGYIDDCQDAGNIEVSILVVVEAALRVQLDDGLNRRLYVSILVVVEAALRVSRYTLLLVLGLSFNPCCSGSGPAGVKKILAVITIRRFQSLL